MNVDKAWETQQYKGMAVSVDSQVDVLKNAGKSRDEIYKKLLNDNVPLDDIEKAYRNLHNVTEKEDAQKKTIQIIVYIGAILIAAGIFSFIASNWQYMGKMAKVITILIAMVAAYGSAWVVKEEYHYTKTGDALFLLGSLIYGAGIFLVAQMFNIRANWPDGFVLWMLGNIVLGCAVRSWAILYGSVILGAISLISSPFTILGTLMGHNPYLLTSTTLLLITAGVTFVTGVLLHKMIPAEYFKDQDV